MKRFSWLFAILTIVLAAPMLAQAQTEPPPPTPVQTGIAERYQPGKINWQPCAENKELECGTLTLPVDYMEPEGETFGMAVVRAKTTDPSKRLGVLFTNPGGPGISGVDQVVFGISSPLFVVTRQRFDVIGFDPRGVGRSRPI